MASPVCNGVDYRKRFNGSRPSSGYGSDNSSGAVTSNMRCQWRGDLTLETLQNLHLMKDIRKEDSTLALVYMYGDWITLPRVTSSGKKDANAILEDRLLSWFAPFVNDLECQVVCGKLRLTEESIDELDKLPPAQLPALAMVSQKGHATSSVVQYLSLPPTAVLLKALHAKSRNSSSAIQVKQAIQSTVRQIESDLELSVGFEKSQAALRIFVAGDRSSVGKSSVCLGMLGNLLNMGYEPTDLAYIKPATQSESTQLIQVFCESKGIACVPIGPLVYYRGFTRAFLAGETAPTETLLKSCGLAVDRLARGKRVILMDGVGFPAVGSICGTDNAAVALACSYPLANGTRKPVGVLLVGGSGVGGAVDAFNLNATYFERAQIPVIGAIFNKLSTDPDNFYSLENCKEQVTKYFDLNEHQRRWNRRPFGFCPLYDKLKGGADKKVLTHADEWIKIFGEHVDVAGVLQAAERVKTNPNLPSQPPLPPRPVKRAKVEEAVKVSPQVVLTRQEIEQAAIRRGAPVSA